jgi:cephalosporin hydroxylase
MTEEKLPPTVEMRLDRTVRELLLERLDQHIWDLYAGVRIAKFPEDLRVYEHLLWASRTNVVIEIGTNYGGSALWFRDRLRTLQSYGRIAEPLVISIDHRLDRALPALEEADPDYADTIKLVKGNVVRDAALPDEVERLLPPGSRCLVVEDSAHRYETTLASLRGFARFVPVGGYFVVEDGCVDIEEMRGSEDWPRGVLPALHEWLESPEGQGFRVRRDLELYGISAYPEGFLQRVE